jgi:HSP20 family protein
VPGRTYGSPWRDLRRLQDEVNELFRGVETDGGRGEYPAVNAWLSNDEVVLTAEVPGVDPESLDISVKGEILTLQGERPRPEPKEGQQIQRQERGYGTFQRSLTLPFRVEEGGVEARYERGVLTMTLPRAEEDKPKKIEVKAG